MANSSNPKTSRRTTCTYTTRASLIQCQQAKKCRENCAKAREVHKTKGREAEITINQEELVAVLEPKKKEGNWDFDLSNVLKWEEAPEVVFAEGPYLHVLYCQEASHR
ncbi:hypothetical protein DSO57_1037192 [Entomophthora muscae]|uniref:Uncharacterized protein n=1 Tax=Entomophthora muscae TaxID=34485 RepID=A0ACC2UIX0_9FUNG|nr:hypothetical protein DSO57_1037192 [Entomophthora muscae]